MFWNKFLEFQSIFFFGNFSFYQECFRYSHLYITTKSWSNSLDIYIISFLIDSMVNNIDTGGFWTTSFPLFCSVYASYSWLTSFENLFLIWFAHQPIIDFDLCFFSSSNVCFFIIFNFLHKFLPKKLAFHIF
jgi:hypothetical protein